MYTLLKNKNDQNDLTDDRLRSNFEQQIRRELVEGNNSAVKKLLLDHHPADIADLIDKLSNEDRERLISIIKNDFDPELLVEFEGSIKRYFIEVLGHKKTAHLISELEIDDAAHVLIGLPQEVQKSVLRYVGKANKKNLEELLSYPEDAAGRFMDKKFVTVPGHWTVAQVTDHIKKLKDLPDDLFEIYVVDPKYTPIGAITLWQVLHSAPTVFVRDIMSNNIRFISPEEKLEDVSFIFKQYNCHTLPVVSHHSNRLIGMITITDALDIVEKEAEEDLMSMAGMKEMDLHQDLYNSVKEKFPWLFVNLITAHLSVIVISMFESTISQIVALATIMPIVASVGGNAGTQTMTVSVLAIASKELSRLNIARVITKQVLSSILNGILLAIIGGIVMSLWQSSFKIGIIFGCAIVINFGIAGFFGSSIPILLKKLNIDPAIASPIFLTTLTDALGYLSFLGLATWFLL